MLVVAFSGRLNLHPVNGPDGPSREADPNGAPRARGRHDGLGGPEEWVRRQAPEDPEARRRRHSEI
eukprot:2180328-Pyramimonas_sp.AAC.1